MPQFRKKPVVIEAEQFHVDSPMPLPFCGEPRGTPVWYHAGCEEPGAACSLDGRHYIRTLEGDHIVSDGDWVIKGVKGEFYPCKPDIFAETYEAVES